MRSFFFLICMSLMSYSWAQDTTLSFENKTFTLADVIIRNNFEYKDIFKDEAAKFHTKSLYEGQLKFPTLFVDDAIYLTPSSDEFNSIMKDLKLRG